MENSLVLHLPHRRLPLEMECEIFKCLKLEIQTKFIWGMGRGIYGMFGQKLLAKTKRLLNPPENRWSSAKTTAEISCDGLKASNKNEFEWLNVFAEKGFAISEEICRKDHFPGTILYYFEIEIIQMPFVWYPFVGLSNKNIVAGKFVGDSANSYGFANNGRDNYWLSGKTHPFERPNGATKPTWEGKGDVIGCGLSVSSKKTLSIFFTANGSLMGYFPLCTRKQIPFNSAVDLLFPTASMWANLSVKANFGNDSSKPLKYDIEKCPGIVFE